MTEKEPLLLGYQLIEKAKASSFDELSLLDPMTDKLRLHLLIKAVVRELMLLKILQANVWMKCLNYDSFEFSFAVRN